MRIALIVAAAIVTAASVPPALAQAVIEEVILRGGGHHALAHRARQRGEDHGGIGMAGMVDRQNECARFRYMLQPLHAQAAVEAYKRHKWPAHQLKARD